VRPLAKLWRSRFSATRQLFLGALLLGLVVAERPSFAGDPPRVTIELTVSQISNHPGGVDLRGAKLNEKLKGQIRYKSLRVIESERVALRRNEVRTLQLPDGNAFHLRPLDFGEDESVLMAVEVEDVLKMDLRARRGHVVVIRAGSHEDGSLVIGVEPVE
jgi:hypothetical protein